MLSEKDNRTMKIIAGLAIICIWVVVVGVPVILGTTVDLLLLCSIVPSFLTILWLDLLMEEARGE